MRLLRLDLLAFGPFDKQTLAVADGQFGVHVIYGPNEAGKSSALRALRQLLYGIEERTPDDFRHPHPSLRIGAVLQDEQGQTLHVVRRKGRKDTLRGPDDVAVVDPDRLTRLLGGIDEAQFRRRFGIDHPTLVKGGEELLHGGGELGAALFAAGTGLADLRSVQERLKADAEELFKHGGSVPRINKSLSEFDRLRKLRKEAQLRPAEWTELVEQLRTAERERTELVQRLAQTRAELERLSRVRQALPRIAKRARLLDELSDVADAPRLPAAFAEQRRAAESARAEAERGLAEAIAATATIDATLAELQVAPAVLEAAAAIGQLQDELAVYRKAAQDRPQLVAQRDAAEADIRATLRELGRDVALEQAPSLQLTQPQRARLREVGREYQALTNRVADTQRRLADLSHETQRCAEQLQTLRAPCDTDGLRRVLRRARRAGDLEQRQAEAEDELRRLHREAEVALKKLGLWAGPWDALETLPLPAAETADRFETEFAAVDETLRDLRREAGELHARWLELDGQSEELRLSRDPPTEDDLAAARQRRDTGWHLIQRAWQGSAGDAPPKPDSTPAGQTTPEPDSAQAGAAARDSERAYIAGCSPARDLAEAYRLAVQQADEIADRLRRESAAVARKAQLVSERHKCAARQSALAAELERQNRRREELESHWRGSWRPAGIDPLTPREMRAWLTRHAALATVASTIRSRTAEVAQLMAQIAGHRAEIARELVAVGAAPPPEDDALADVLDAGEQLVQRLDTDRDRRQQLESDWGRWSKQLAAVQPEAAQAQAELTQWRERWAQAVAALALPADATPTEANEVTSAIDQLLRKLDKTAGLRERIEAIDRDNAGFADRARQLLARVALDLQPLPVDRAVGELAQRLEQCQAAGLRRQELTDTRRREEQRAADARRRSDDAQSTLAALCRTAGCSAAEELPGIEQRARQRADREAELRTVEDQLLELAAGGSLADVVAAAAQVEAASLDARLSQWADDVHRLEQQRDAVGERLGGLQNTVRQRDGSDRAAQTEEEMQSVLARIRLDAEQYIRWRLGAVVLQQAVERFRERNQGPVLQRASQRFNTLTAGSFAALRADWNDRGEPVLVGVRPGGTPVGVDGMSEGTRDQLYLALRLASLEHYLDHNPPLPFIIDDCLVQFDDQRAAAALQLLGQLSDRTQVIFFTHHQHLVDLARTHVASGRLFLHPLG